MDMGEFTCDDLTNVGNNNYTKDFQYQLNFIGFKETVLEFTELKLHDIEKKSSDFWDTIIKI